jgi:hypothetical protein
MAGTNPYPAGTRAADLYATAISKGLPPETAQTYVERMLGAQRKYKEEEQATQKREERLRQARAEAQERAHPTGSYQLTNMRRGSVESLLELRQAQANADALRSAYPRGPLPEPEPVREYTKVVLAP